jgi:hypothetical protein
VHGLDFPRAISGVSLECVVIPRTTCDILLDVALPSAVFFAAWTPLRYVEGLTWHLYEVLIAFLLASPSGSFSTVMTVS